MADFFAASRDGSRDCGPSLKVVKVDLVRSQPRQRDTGLQRRRLNRSSEGGGVILSDMDEDDDCIKVTVPRPSCLPTLRSLGTFATRGKLWLFAASGEHCWHVPKGLHSVLRLTEPASDVLSEWLASPQMTMGAAVGSFLLGLRWGSAHGLGVAAPTAVGTLSALAAFCGSVSCVCDRLEAVALAERSGDAGYEVGKPSDAEGKAAGTVASARRTVELQPWATSSLAALCGALAPLPLAWTPQAFLGGVSGPVYTALPGAIGIAVMFELAHRRLARVDPDMVNNLLAMENMVNDSFLSSWFDAATVELIVKHWRKHFDPFGGGGVGAVFLLTQVFVTACGVQIDLAMTAWRASFFNVLQAKDVVAFNAQMFDFLPIAAASVFSSVYDGYLTTMWDLRWREELVKDFVGMWLRDRAFYLSRFTGNSDNIDNFDQRIVEDTGVFASSSRLLICGAASALMRLAVFGPALVRISPTPRIWQLCLTMSLLSSLATHFVGQPLAARNAALQRCEADFRSSLMRLRIFAEDIALQRGEHAEEAAAAQLFEGIKAATWLAARGVLNLTLFTSIYALAGGILPFIVLVPSYFHGDITLGVMFQIEGIVQGVRQSLDFFVGAYGEIAVWRAATDRLLALEKCCLHQSQVQAALRDEASAAVPDIVVTGLTLHRETGDAFFTDISFRWRLGDRVLLSGPASGGALAALLRRLAGARPLARSSGSSFVGVCSGVMLVSSTGFVLPPHSSLRDCLAYPEKVGAYDEDLMDALRLCGLPELAEQLDVRADWPGRLPGADRQRLLFARLLARWPSGIQWLLLCDADNALDGEVAADLVSILFRRATQAVGVVVASRHPQVWALAGARCFHAPGDGSLTETDHAEDNSLA